ncbi:MAG TPA: acyltransferase [Longimicrobiales bacterium]|nr:acyltransferase [Longimicrobiales bacterium]
MAFLPLRPVAIGPDAQARYDEWVTALDRALDDPHLERNVFCRQVLEQIYAPYLTDSRTPEIPLVGRILRDQLDPANVTTESEYYREVDLERYRPVKPLLWLWEMFDRSPLGENVSLGVPFRRILAKRIFRRCGKNFKAFHQVKLSFGYNMEVGDDVVVHRHVLLDDRGGIVLGNGVSVSDYANIYSHTHDLVDGRIVFTPKTVLEDRVRVTYHATILAGTTVAHDSMVGALSTLTKDTEPRGVYVGSPARKIREKPEAALARRRRPTGDPLQDEGPPALRPEDPEPPHRDPDAEDPDAPHLGGEGSG